MGNSFIYVTITVLLTEVAFGSKKDNVLSKKIIVSDYIEKLQNNQPAIYCELTLFSIKRDLDEAFNEFSGKIQDTSEKVELSIERYVRFKQFASEKQKTEEMKNLRHRLRILVEQANQLSVDAKPSQNLATSTRPGSRENTRIRQKRLSMIDRSNKTVIGVCWMPLKIGFKRIDIKSYCPGDTNRLRVVFRGSQIKDPEISHADFQGETNSDKYFYVRSMSHSRYNTISFNEQHCGLVVSGTKLLSSLVVLSVLFLIK